MTHLTHKLGVNSMSLKSTLLLGLSFFMSFKTFGAPLSSKITADRFHQVFTTAAYSTALGGAIGTAALVFTPQPSENLRFIAVGASIGFLSGILLGGYLAFIPSFGKSSSSDSAFQELGPRVPMNTDIPTVEAMFAESGELEQVALHFPRWKL